MQLNWIKRPTSPRDLLFSHYLVHSSLTRIAWLNMFISICICTLITLIYMFFPHNKIICFQFWFSKKLWFWAWSCGLAEGKKTYSRVFKRGYRQTKCKAATVVCSQTRVYSHVFYKRRYSLRVYSRVSITAAKNLQQYLPSPQPPSTFTPASSLHHNTGVGWLLVCFIRTFLCKESANTRVEENNNDFRCSGERFLFIYLF